MTRKRLIIVLGIICVVAVVTAVIVVLQNPKNKQIPTGVHAPSVLVDSPPRIIDVPIIPNSASFVYVGTQKTIPSVLPIYQYTEDLSSNTLYTLGDTVSSQFSVTGSPSAVIDNDYFAYMRNEKYKWFSLSKTKQIVSISYQRLLTQDATLVVQNDNPSVLSFFSQLFPLSETMSLSSLPTGQIPTDGVIFLDSSPVTTSTYSFGVSIDGRPLLTRENTIRWASIIIDSRGAIRILNYILPPAVTRGQDVQIISVMDAVANINVKRADMLWITNTNGDYSVAPAFTSGELSEYTLVYVYQNNILVPAYLFEGSGKTQNGDTQVFEVLVLALPSSR
jgi:hypothetical protein